MSVNKSLEYLEKLMEEFKSKDLHMLIYGCNGYTATLILQLLNTLDFVPEQIVFAARNPVSLTETLVYHLGEKFTNIRVVAFPATEKDIANIFKNEKFSVVLNCAGPFVETAYPFIRQCVESGVSYVDITGEVEIFEYVLNHPDLNEKAEQKNIVIMPGVGFDVVPSDCSLKKTTEEYMKKYKELPHKLEIMITASNSSEGVAISHGTKKTMVRGFAGSKPVTRINGKLDTPVVLMKDFPIKDDKTSKPVLRKGSTLPWGDISSGYYSTRVPNIHVFMPNVYPNETIASILNSTIVSYLIQFFLALPFMMRLVDWSIERAPRGPNKDAREQNTGSMYTIATSKDGSKKHENYLFVKEGYQLTAETALASALRVALKKTNKVGCVTPSIAFGSDYIQNFDKCEFLKQADVELD